MNYEIILERQRTAKLLLRPENSEVRESIAQLLKRITNIRADLNNLHMGMDRGIQARSFKKSAWAKIDHFARYSIQLKEALFTLTGGETLDISQRIHHQVDFGQIRAVGEMIKEVVDFDNSEDSQHAAVLPGVDEELDEMKRRYFGLVSFVDSEVRFQITQRIPQWARPCLKHCTIHQQFGFLIAVAMSNGPGATYYSGEGLEKDMWQLMFEDNGFAYFKDNAMRGLDQEHGNLCRQIADIEVHIIHTLGLRVLEHEDALTTASDLFGELDSLLALALGAGRNDWVAPEMTDSNAIYIRAGRHPLQELVVPAFIANSCKLVGGSADAQFQGHEPDIQGPSMLVITGPNHSGKSIYLKQVALIVYLAHIGSFVPADYAVIGFTDRILTRISTRESVARHESAFGIDLRQAAFAMNFATRRSLVLIDEFGKGTNPHNGIGLLTSLLHHFLSLGRERSRVLVASHFHEMFHNGFLDDQRDKHLGFAHMAVHTQDVGDGTGDQITFLFKLKPGLCYTSLGLRCAAQNGVNEAVVERAGALVELIATGDDLQAACARLTEEEEKQLEMAENAARRFVEMDFPEPATKAIRLTPVLNRSSGLRDENCTVQNALQAVLSPCMLDKSPGWNID